MGIDIYAPIIPYEGLGGIKLYSTREELKELLEMDGVTKDNEPWGGLIQYYIEDKISLIFCVANDKLFKICALEGYRGKLFRQVEIGMTKEELLEAEASFVYDDFEECWITHKGASLSIDSSTHKVNAIGVWVAELNKSDCHTGNW